MKWTALPSAGIALAMLLHSAGAIADSIRVEVTHCTLRVDEIERLVRLELGTVLRSSDNLSAYHVMLHCTGPQVRIQIHDPLTDKTVERTVIAPPPDQPEPERALALAVAQLYRASWLELVADDAPPLPPARPVTERSAAIESAREVVEPTLSPRASSRFHWSLGLGGGARLRHLQDPLVLPKLGLQAAFWPTSNTWVFGVGNVEWANQTRTTGAISTLLVHGGAGFGVAPLVSGEWSGFAELEVGFTYTRIAGSDVPEGFATAVVAGGGFDGSAAIGAAWSPPPIRIELLGMIGLLAGSPAGLVEGDDEVSLDGAWTGAELRLRWML